MVLNAFNEGKSEKTRKISTQRNSTLSWRTSEKMEVTMNLALRESESVSGEERVATVGAQQIEDKPLVLIQINCRSILNKTLEFWNLVDTYNTDVIIGTESWLREEINNAEVFRDDYTTFRRDRCTRGAGVFICVKN